MTTCVHPAHLLRRRNRRQDKRLRMLRRLAAMRAAKERRRLARTAAGATDPPRMLRWIPIELGLRDRATGETAWVPFQSLRDALRRLSTVLRYYRPGIPTRPQPTTH